MNKTAVFTSLTILLSVAQYGFGAESLAFKEQFHRVLDEIKGREYYLNYLPKQLRGPKDNPNLLERMPKWVVNMIIQCIHQNDLYHERSFYVPSHRSEPEKEGPIDIEFLQSPTINFIDGNPDRLELAWCPPQQRIEYPRSTYLSSVDVITIDTTTCTQNIKKHRGIEKRKAEEKPKSYQQRVIGDEFNATTSPGLLPLVQQLSCMCKYKNVGIGWREDNSSYYKRKTKNYQFTNAFCWVKVRIAHPYICYPYGDGLQRNLLNGRMLWILPKDNCIGIYEKAMKWYDAESAFRHSKFKPVTQDYSGTTFHLVQVIEEEAPVEIVALPHTPVYLRDTEGRELKGWLGCPPYTTTAHLRSPDEYPERIDALAIGLNLTSTNTRLSLYKQRGDKLLCYPPELLLHQNSLVTPKKKDRLYPDEPDMPRPS